jgi:translation initiation factor IF-2
VLVKRGTLRVGDIIVAGTTSAKVRRMTTSSGGTVRKAPPGTAVEVTGWKERPAAGDLVLQADNESNAKLAIRNRITKEETRRDQEDIEAVNASRISARRERWLEREKKLVAEENARSGQSLPGIIPEGEDAGPKKLRVLIKADVSGSAEAVEEAIKDLGNHEVGVQVVDTTVGEINEGDIMMASAANGISCCRLFNVQHPF